MLLLEKKNLYKIVNEKLVGLPSVCLGVTTLNAEWELLSVILSVLTLRLKSSGMALIGDTSILRLNIFHDMRTLILKNKLFSITIFLLGTLSLQTENGQELALRQRINVIALQINRMHNKSSISLLQIHFALKTCARDYH